MKKVILASGSPRRRELLSGLDIDFEVDTENYFKESVDDDIEPRDVPAAMSVGKSHGFHRALSADEVLVTADTVVVVGSSVLGKPHSREEAVGMLRRLSGCTHEVITAVTVRDVGTEETFTDSTLVTFAKIPECDIEYYVDTYKPYDKAGAYGIQEWIGYSYITGISGSFYNVMGFPVHKVYKALSRYMGRALTL